MKKGMKTAHVRKLLRNGAWAGRGTITFEEMAAIAAEAQVTFDTVRMNANGQGLKTSSTPARIPLWKLFVEMATEEVEP